MAKKLETKPPGWADPPLPLNFERPRSQPRQSLKLVHLMIAILYFAAVCAVGREALQSYQPLMLVVVGLLVGLGLIVFGLWIVYLTPHFPYIGWCLFVVGYMLIMFSTISVFALPTLPLLIGAIIYVSLRRRSTNQDAMLGVLMVAAEAKIPLMPGVLGFASQVTGMSEVWAASLAELLRRGMSLPQAIERVPKVVPHESSILIRMGWESGNLAAGLHQASATRARQMPVLRDFGTRLAYLSWVILVGQSIVSFVLYFIMPKFEAIFKDFGTELPQITVLVIEASHFLVGYAWIFFLFQIALLIYLAVSFAKTGTVQLPFFDRLFKRRHIVLVQRSLSIVVAENRQIVPSLYSLAQCYPSGWVRNRLEHAAEQSSQGADPVEALRKVGLLSSSDAMVLESARRVGNMSWAFNERAETGERRWAYQILALTQVFFVVAMLLIGLMALILALAYFLPLVNLISRFAE